MKKLVGCFLLAVVLFFNPLRVLRADEGVMLAKMSEISEGQKKILEMLEQIKSELQIVKIRASNR